MAAPRQLSSDEQRLQSRTRSAVADRVSAVADPVIVVPALLAWVSVRHSNGWLTGLGWAGLAVVFTVVAPYAVLLVLVRTGRVDDRHVVSRRQRYVPMTVAFVSILVGVGLLARLGAPNQVVALQVAMVLGGGLVSGVTFAYKASVHTGVAAGCASVLTIELGAAVMLAVVPVVVAIGWARERAGRHTWPQILLGAAIGAAASCAVYLPYAG